MHCANCGSQLDKDAAYCSKCGKAVSHESAQIPSDNELQQTSGEAAEKSRDEVVLNEAGENAVASEKRAVPFSKKGKVAVLVSVALLAALGVGLFAFQSVNLNKGKDAMLAGDFDTAASALSKTWFGNEAGQYKQLADAFSAEDTVKVMELADSSTDATYKYSAGLWLMNRWSTKWQELEKAASFFSDAGDLEGAEQNALTCSNAAELFHAEELLKLGRMEQGKEILESLPNDFEWRNIKVAQRVKLLNDYEELLASCGSYDLIQNDGYCNNRTIKLDETYKNAATVDCHLTDSGEIQTTVSATLAVITWANEVLVDQEEITCEASEVLKPLKKGSIYTLETSYDNAAEATMSESYFSGDIAINLFDEDTIVLDFTGKGVTDGFTKVRMPTMTYALYKKS